MTMNELMKLVDAGFTKSEIMAITGNGVQSDTDSVTEPTDVSHPTETTPAPVVNSEVVESTPQPNPTTTNVNFAPLMTDSQIEKLAQLINRGNASIDMPTQKPVSEVLGEHFADIMNGK